MCQGVPEGRPRREAVHEAVKVKNALLWRSQDVRDARSVGFSQCTSLYTNACELQVKSRGRHDEESGPERSH